MRYLFWMAIVVSMLALHGGQLCAQSSGDIRKTTISIFETHFTHGGIVATDLDQDHRMEFLITAPGRIGAYDLSGNQLWQIRADIRLSKKAEDEGLPGLHAPGVQAGDVDGDQVVEVLFLTEKNEVVVLNGLTGQVEKKVQMDRFFWMDQWEHLVLANLRGQGNRDLVLQAADNFQYRVGRFIIAYSWEGLTGSSPQPLWYRKDFLPTIHSGLRVADLDGDGRDEIIGGSIVSGDGQEIYRLPVIGHLDSVYILDARPDIAGLEIVALEESHEKLPFENSNSVYRFFNRMYRKRYPEGNHVYMYHAKGLIWRGHNKHQEPQNAAVGEFDPSRPGLEVWCRSRYNTDQTPFVFDARGQLIAGYEFKHLLPRDWTNKGVEEISTIAWTGDTTVQCAAKERHKAGKVGIFDPMTGKFIHVFQENAHRVYVADVLGDWREELIVVTKDWLHIYENTAINPNPDHKRFWDLHYYRQSKMTWNYYNP